MYHVFVSPMFYAEQIKNGGAANEVKRVSIPEARKLISEAKFRKNVMYCTSNVNKKM